MPSGCFADLPGYGYAKLPREQTAEWPKFIEPYLQERESLTLCIVLVDANVPPQHSDKQLVEWLQHVGRRYAIVATKADRLSGNKLTHAMHGLRKDYQTRAHRSFFHPHRRRPGRAVERDLCQLRRHPVIAPLVDEYLDRSRSDSHRPMYRE